jgi:transmembrane sensor
MDKIRSRHNQLILDQAAEWFVEFREGDVDTVARGEFNRWVRLSPQHIEAYLEVAAFWADVPSFTAKEDIDVQALIAYARSEDNVVSLGATARSATDVGCASSTVRRSKWGTGPLALAILLLALAIGAGGAAWIEVHRGIYATDVGEQRSMTLDDGSTVELNAKSRIRVLFGPDARNVELLEGQALFHVAHDKKRPFTVSSGDTHVRAVGTQFDMYRQTFGTTVTVLEGQVAIQEDRKAAAIQPLLLSAGQQVVVSPRSVALPKPADVAATTAWTQRRLVFEGTSLGDVVEEFNRYNRRQLVIAGRELRNLRVSGVFSSTEPTSLLRFLRDELGLKIDEREGGIVISRDP